MVQKFREIAKNHLNENFCDKNFVIATFFRDYRRSAALAWTIHIVAPPTNLARGIGLDVCLIEQYSVKRNAHFTSEAFNPYGLWLDALCRRDTSVSRESSNLRNPFAVNAHTHTRTYVELLH